MGYYPLSFGVDSCSKNLSKKEKLQTELIYHGDTLEVHTYGMYNCCHSLLADVNVTEDSLLNLTALGYGNYCFCTCTYHLIYTFHRWHIPHAKGLIIGGDRKRIYALPH